MKGGRRSASAAVLVAVFAGIVQAASLGPAAQDSVDGLATGATGIRTPGNPQSPELRALTATQFAWEAPAWAYDAGDPGANGSQAPAWRAAEPESANVATGALQLVAVLIDRVQGLPAAGEPVFILMLGTVMFGLGAVMRARLSRTGL